ncbi:hypothetical protein ACIP98_41500 [Streptomyces sp. NPDC088354]|uniref:hypothetical protein n=1 Tax=Streptomyces sp. NPDC088354 TaxID=3365856 RepID=UPI003830C899
MLPPVSALMISALRRPLPGQAVAAPNHAAAEGSPPWKERSATIGYFKPAGKNGGNFHGGGTRVRASSKDGVFSNETAALKCVCQVSMSLELTGKSQARWTMC